MKAEGRASTMRCLSLGLITLVVAVAGAGMGWFASAGARARFWRRLSNRRASPLDLDLA
jgi:hypothetical protein